MKRPVYIDQKPVIDFEDHYDEATIPATNVETLVLSRQLKTGKRPFLTVYAQGWDSAMDTFNEHHLYVNGTRHERFPSSTVQLDAPEDPKGLPVRIELPQGALVEVYMNSTVAGQGAARIAVEYEDY